MAEEIARRDNPPIEDPGRAHMGLMRVVDLDGDGGDELLVLALRPPPRLGPRLQGALELAGSNRRVRAGPSGVVRPAGDGAAQLGGGPRRDDGRPALDGATRSPVADLAARDPRSGRPGPSAPARLPGAGCDHLPGGVAGDRKRHVRASARHRGAAGPRPSRPAVDAPLALEHLVLHPVGVTGFLSASGLALVNAVLPLGLLWLAAADGLGPCGS